LDGFGTTQAKKISMRLYTWNVRGSCKAGSLKETFKRILKYKDEFKEGGVLWPAFVV
jgi:hypothetical protein